MIFRLIKDPFFPDPELSEEDGLLAIGGDLSVQRLVNAYGSGIFPWYNEGTEILWWSPNPRFVIKMEDFTVRKSLRKFLLRSKYTVTFNKQFEKVIRSCSKVERAGQDGTWIIEDMIRAYTKLHKKGYAISVEVMDENELIGGLYGVILGKMFAGESMFSNREYASQVGFVALYNVLKENGFHFIDCQVSTDHLKQFGAKEIERKEFLKMLKFAIES
ncbi:MAG: leucyl/phenylalanyl-tRNA--protein transferase [Candidatus Delongbacteria bacterium]|nr:leucyl/phenylalanyl-tRNA--protein transferase [Candidatus Delongbacteria bacterium]MBN2835345.1 leucyl/phenylalanyl-tRNA--protein transferase [Candidatus Delongbacteria bacterium]